MINFRNSLFLLKLIPVILFSTTTGVFAQSTTRDLNIVFIGNSITHGAGLNDAQKQAPPVEACTYLRKKPGIGIVTFSNQGYSGFTTVDFLPATQTAFLKVEQAAKAFTNKQALLIFSLKLGTNDSAIKGPNGSPVSPSAYLRNLQAIADSLLKEFPGCILIINQPIWYSPNTYNGAQYLQEGLTRLQSYFPLIDHLVADFSATYPKRVFTGDKKAFNYFKKNYLILLQPEQGHLGTFYLHPNEHGAFALGDFWGEAIYKVLKLIY